MSKIKSPQNIVLSNDTTAVSNGAKSGKGEGKQRDNIYVKSTRTKNGERRNL